MSYKKRSPEEIKSIMDDITRGLSYHEISVKHDISESGIRHILTAGEREPRASNTTRRIKSLEKQLREKEEEIALLKSALKKR